MAGVRLRRPGADGDAKHPRGAFDAVFSASGRRLAATIGGDGKVSLWDMSGETGRPRGLGGVDSGQMGNRRSSMALSPDGRARRRPYLRLLLPVGRHRPRPRPPAGARTDVGHIGPVGAIAFSPDGSRVATGSVDGALVLWDVTDRSRPRRIGPALYSRRIGFPLSMLFLPGGRTLAVQGISSVDLWDLSEVASPGADLLPEACARLGGASLDRAAWKAHAGETAYVMTCRGADG
ncbi:WD40 repeat domain-containing protein [Streptomyces tricolor]|nr:WD40 repeat domain-containing protein [Streptomyces tricolor]